MTAFLFILPRSAFFRIALLLPLTAFASASEPQESAKQLLEQADQLQQKTKLDEARTTYQQVLSRETDWQTPTALRALQGAVNCALKLGEWDEAWARIHRFRTYRGKEGKRWQWSSSNSAPEWNQGEIKKLEGIRLLSAKLQTYLNDEQTEASPERKQKQIEEQAATNFAIIEVLLGNDIARLPRDTIDARSWWNIKEDNDWLDEGEPGNYWSYLKYWHLGVPLGADGKPQFVGLPQRYSPELGIGVKVLFLLDEIERLDTTPGKNYAARALLWHARIAEGLYGPNTDDRWREAHWDFDSSQRPYFAGVVPKQWTRPSQQLADDEVRTKVNGHTQIIKLPEKENPLALLRRIEQIYPGSSVLPDALYARGEWYQSRQQFKQAITSYGALLKNYPEHDAAKAAAAQIENIFKPGVLLWPTTFYAAGDKPLMPFASRRTSRIHFTAQKIDLAAYQRNEVVPAFLGTNTLFSDYGFLPDFTDERDHGARAIRKYFLKRTYWSETVQDSESIFLGTTRVPISEPGAYIVEAEIGNGNATSRVMLVITDIAIVHRRLRDKSLLYVADALTGRPVAGQEVYLWNNSKERQYSKLISSAEGIIETAYNGKHDRLIGAISRSGGPALITIPADYRNSTSQEERATVSYAITDRPVYRPGSQVHFRLYQRHSIGRLYLPPQANECLQVSIIGPHGHTLQTLQLHTDAFGGVSGEFPLSGEAALGDYSIQIEGRHCGSHGSFRVESYKKPEFEVTVNSPSSVRAGDKVHVRIAARYLFGGAVAGGRARYQIRRQSLKSGQPVPHEFDWLYGPGYCEAPQSYSWLAVSEQAASANGEENPSNEDHDSSNEEDLPVRQGEADLSTDGILEIELDTLPGIEQRFTIVAEVRDASRRTVRGRGEVLVSAQELQLQVSLDRNWYLSDAPITAIVAARSPRGAGVAALGKLRIERVVYSGPDHEKVVFETVKKLEVQTGADGRAIIRLPVLLEGQYRIVFQVPDSPRKYVSADVVFWVHGPRFRGSDFRLVGLEVIPDRSTYKVGDVAHLLVHVAQPNSRILFSDDMRPDWLQNYRFLDIPGYAAVIEIPIEERHVPNFFVGATTVAHARVISDVRELFVPPVRDLLKVQVEAKKSDYRPGEKAELRVSLQDQAGMPVAGQATVAVYDKAITYIQDELGSPPSVLLQRARLRWEIDMGRMQEVQEFRATGQLIRPEYEIGGHSRLATPAGQQGESGGTPDVQEQVRELSRPKLQDSTQRLRRSSASGNELEPKVRTNFADTALWRAAVDIGSDGKANVAFAFPDSLTTWRLRAFGITPSSQAGEATAEVTTSKKLLVRLQAPRFLVEGDEVVLSANVHNALKSEKQVTAELVVPAALLEPADNNLTPVKPDAEGNLHLRSQATVVAGGARRFDWRCKVLKSGSPTLTVKALTDDESDAMRLQLPILAQGIPIVETRTGSLPKDKDQTQVFTVAVPDKSDPRSTYLELLISPGPAGVMGDALPFLISYPYGCTEQTMSRFYPTIIAADALKKSGIDLESLGKRQGAQDKQPLADRFYDGKSPIFDSSEMNRMAQAGLERLYRFQHKDSGWGWWEHDDSSPYMTAFVLMGLVSAEKAGFKVEASVIKGGYSNLEGLIGREPLRKPEEVAKQDWETQALIAYVLSLDSPSRDAGRDRLKSNPGPKVLARSHRETLIQQIDQLGPYAKSLLAIACHNTGERAQAQKVLHSLLGSVVRDDPKGTGWLRISEKEYWHWWNSDVETTAWALRALLLIEPEHDLGPRFVKWLVDNRHGGRFWRSTRDTAMAVAALAEFVSLHKTELAECRMEIQLDGQAAWSSNARLIASLSPGPKDARKICGPTG